MFLGPESTMRPLSLFSVLAGLMWTPAAQAGDDPWVLSRGDVALYSGVSGTSWTTFSGAQGSLSGNDVAISTRVLTHTAVFAGEVGVTQRSSVELRLAGGWSQVTYTGSKNCTGTTCDTEVGAMPVDARYRFRVLDEIMGSPVTLTVGPVLRIGAHTRGARDQFTSMGDGQNDVGAHLSVGRMAIVGPLLVVGYGAARYSHRVLQDPEADQDVPRHELAGVAELTVQPRQRLQLGLVVDGLHRPDGRDWGEGSTTSEDRFAALSMTSIKVGAKFGLVIKQGFRLHLSAMTTAYARNNPSDGWAAGFGLSWYRPAAQAL